MTDRRQEIETEAMRIVDNWQDEADPEAALAALQKDAPKGMDGVFAMLWSELAMAMNEGASDDPQ